MHYLGISHIVSLFISWGCPNDGHMAGFYLLALMNTGTVTFMGEFCVDRCFHFPGVYDQEQACWTTW